MEDATLLVPVTIRKIRTYNFRQDRITDHRIGYSRSSIPQAMNGDIDDLIEKLQAAEREIKAQGI